MSDIITTNWSLEAISFACIGRCLAFGCQKLRSLAICMNGRKDEGIYMNA